MRKSGVKGFRNFLIIISSFLFLLVSLLFLVFVIQKIGKLKNVEKSSKNEFKYEVYKYLQYNPFTNESGTGFLTLHRKLDEDEFVRYDHPDESQVLISNYGTQEYECVGTCYCDKLENIGHKTNTRKSGSIVIRRGLVLVAAISSLFALQYAKDELQEYCVDKLSETCDQDSHIIRSEIEDCHECNNIIPLNHEYEYEDMEFEEEGSFDKFYRCSGECMFYNYYELEGRSILLDEDRQNVPWELMTVAERRNFFCVMDAVDEVDCRKYRMKKEVHVKYSKRFEREVEEKIKTAKGVKDPNLIERYAYNSAAVVHFLHDHLDPFCMDQSETVVFKNEEIDNIHEELDREYLYEHGLVNAPFPMCTGMEWPGAINPSVHCAEMFKKKEFYGNRKYR